MGYDAGKKVKGRKIHALVDTLGLPMRVVVHSAGTQDRDGAALVLDKIRTRFPWLELVWAYAGYNARQVDQVGTLLVDRLGACESRSQSLNHLSRHTEIPTYRPAKSDVRTGHVSDLALRDDGR